MVHHSQSLATQTNHFALLFFPHCQIMPNATGGPVIFSVSLYGKYTPYRTGLLSIGKAHTVEYGVKDPRRRILNFGGEDWDQRFGVFSAYGP